MEALTFVGELTVTTCWCGIRHAVPKELADFQRRQHRDGAKQTAIYCPLGHTHILAGEGEAAKLARELKEERDRLARTRAAHDQTKAELRETERRRLAQKGVTTRIKNRVASGTCPCCGRPFANLMRHMQKQHPDFERTDDYIPDKLPRPRRRSVASSKQSEPV